MIKNLSKNPTVLGIAGTTLGGYLHLLSATSRQVEKNRSFLDESLAHEKGLIVAFWHGRLGMISVAAERAPVRVNILLSQNETTASFARAVKGFDAGLIHGSAANPKKPEKNKGGAGAIVQMHAALDAGEIVAMTPDGPRGPRATVNPGIIRLAEATGAPILPLGLSTSIGKSFNSWDKFLAPFLFSKIAIVVGAPLYDISAGSKAKREHLCALLKTRIDEATDEADALCGRVSKNGTAQTAEE